MESKEKNGSLAAKEEKKKDSKTITPKIEVNKKLGRVKQGQIPIRNKNGLSARELLFIDKYLEINNIAQAAIYAGYSEKTAASKGCQLLKKEYVQQEIHRRREKITASSIATAQQVMEFFTKAMNGEIKDQFGLEASLADRTRAAVELAKRTVDLDNRINGKPDNVVEIKLDWSRDKEEDK